ncbi:hypothetical protein POM88_031045 [Heracleum sosnowskyi]|uniref:Uncharacterized protein n=1 Tax=Heracleum sosnowskyi TaxID=360622 RepID=A0AAD8MJ85_9APIA|nr:hypothetical protein POM88_031045 [Heracleum sosnowskyi]
MFPGHQQSPSNVLWDTTKGHVACVCFSQTRPADRIDILYVWDMKTGARERGLHRISAHSMFDHCCSSIDVDSLSFAAINACISASTESSKAASDFSEKRHIENLGVDMPNNGDKRGDYMLKKQGAEVQSTQDMASSDDFGMEGPCLSLWNIASGKLHLKDVFFSLPYLFCTCLLGDKGSLTLTFPARSATLELWKSSYRSSVRSDHSGRQGNARASNETDRLKLLIHNLDLWYRLQWDEFRLRTPFVQIEEQVITYTSVICCA